MKDLKAFAKDLPNDKNLAQKVKKAKTAKEVVSIAADNGYSFDENNLLAVSGGVGDSGIVGDINTGDIDMLDFDFSHIDATIQQNISGAHNTGQNTGSVNVNKGK